MMSKSIFQSKTGTDYMKWTQIRYCIGQLPTEAHKKWGSEGREILNDVIKLLRCKAESFESYQFKT